MPKDLIIPDITTAPLPVFEPADAFVPVIAAGYRSFMSVRLPAREQVIDLSFWSKRPGAFEQRDLPLARRIAVYVALSVSHEQLIEAERQATEAQARAERLEARVQMLSEELESKTQIRVVGESAEWRDVLKKATQVAETDTTVLVTGESGTGKEVVARFIHRASARSRGPFVALNCAALPEQLLESELFGYERGAFTSAQQAKPGQIELAAGGVLFLDEVTEMSLAAQAKFLRVLQEREFQRLGATRILKANIRVIAATNRDLRKAVERGDFREDLFYRLKVFDIVIPPLRERAADILPISEALLQDIGKSFARPPAGLTREAREALLRYHWPGNVRELRNALERAAILCEGGLIRRGAPRTGSHGQATGCGLDRPRHDRARDHRAGPARVPLEQDAGRQAPRPHAHSALSATAEVWAREAAGGVAPGRLRRRSRRVRFHCASSSQRGARAARCYARGASTMRESCGYVAR